MTRVELSALSGLFDAVDELFLVFDGGGIVLEWNRSVVETTGYSDEELADATLTDLFEGSVAARLRDVAPGTPDSGATAVDADLLTATGDRIPCEFEVRRVSGGGEPAILAVAGREATGPDRAGRGRGEFLDRMSDGFLAIDTEWAITYVNETAKRVLSELVDRDRDDEALEGLHLWSYVPDDAWTVAYERLHDAMKTREAVSFEEYVPSLDAWLDVRAYPSGTGLSVYFHDVTERRRQTEMLQNRQRVLREMHDIIADRNRPFTEQVTALLELGRAELDTAYGTLSKIRGEDYVFEMVDTDDDSVRAGDVVPLSATNCEIAATREETLVLGDVARDAPEETDRAGYTDWGIKCYVGAPVFVDGEVYGTFCFYDTAPRDGQFSEWEVTLIDLMSNWVSYELGRRETNERLRRQTERLERFAAVVSHDLRNPLAVLAGRLELAEETGDPEQFAHCHRAVERMDTLIDNLLALARLGEVIDDREDVDLGSLVESSWQNVPTGDATLRVETERTVRADETRLQQLLENLLRNSVEHGGDTVTVTVGDLPDGFHVEDDGPGIPAEKREEWFESDLSTIPEGLGLSIVEEIADAHDWDVRVTDGTDGGARFEFVGVSDGV